MSNKAVHLPQKVSPVFVQQVDLFADIPVKFVEHFQLNEWQVNDYIDPRILSERFFVIFEGQIEIKQSHPDTGREVTLDMLYAGDCFDLMVLFDEQPHAVIISPLTKVKLLSVEISLMRQWLWTYPEFNRQFMPYLAKKMREKEQQVSDLVLCDVSTRLSRIILQHINKIKLYNGPNDEAYKYHLVNGLNDETLARMAGSVRQVVNKQLQDLKNKGIIEKKRNQLIIKNLEALEKEAQYTHELANRPEA